MVSILDKNIHLWILNYLIGIVYGYNKELFYIDICIFHLNSIVNLATIFIGADSKMKIQNGKHKGKSAYDLVSGKVGARFILL